MSDQETTTVPPALAIDVRSAMTLEDALPAGFVVQRDGDSLSLTARWLNKGDMWPIAVVLAINAHVVWGQLTGRERSLVAFKAALALLLTYAATARVLNRTRITVSQGQITVMHGPIPWSRSTAISTADLHQIEVVSQEVRRRNGPDYWTWDVVAKRKSGPPVAIVNNVVSPEHAYAIELALEKHMGIADRAAH